MEEEWADIEGYENKYQVSNLGNVRSLNYNNTHQPRELKQKLNHCGYYEVKLSKNNKTKDFLVHKLVAETFIKNTKNYDAVTHIDGNKLNNKVDNLLWIYKEQICFFQHKDYNNGYIVSYNGKAYSNFSQLARDYNIEPQLFFKRLENGWNFEETLEIPRDREKLILNVRLYKYNGKLYTIKQLSQISGLTTKTLYKRLARGWNIDETVEIPTGERKRAK